jgi:hypothetical protein
MRSEAKWKFSPSHYVTAHLNEEFINFLFHCRTCKKTRHSLPVSLQNVINTIVLACIQIKEYQPFCNSSIYLTTLNV